jgi:hypothetical protein
MADRTTGGISGSGGKNVDKVYKPMSEAQTARNLKAIEEIRKQLGAKAPTAEELAKRAKEEKIKETERIRGRSSRGGGMRGGAGGSSRIFGSIK